MDVWPDHLTMPRRRMRRPVAGAFPDPLEDWLDVIEEPWEPPALVYFGIGFLGGAIVLAGAAFLALAAWFERTFGKL